MVTSPLKHLPSSKPRSCIHTTLGTWCSCSQYFPSSCMYTPCAKLHSRMQADQDTRRALAPLHLCIHRARSLLHFTSPWGISRLVLSPQLFQQLGKCGRCFSPLHLWRVLMSQNAMGDHEVLAAEVPGGVVLQAFKNEHKSVCHSTNGFDDSVPHVCVCMLLMQDDSDASWKCAL